MIEGKLYLPPAAERAAQAAPAYAFFLGTAVESSKVVSASTAVGGRAA